MFPPHSRLSGGREEDRPGAQDGVWMEVSGACPTTASSTVSVYVTVTTSTRPTTLPSEVDNGLSFSRLFPALGRPLTPGLLPPVDPPTPSDRDKCRGKNPLGRDPEQDRVLRSSVGNTKLTSGVRPRVVCGTRGGTRPTPPSDPLDLPSTLRVLITSPARKGLRLCVNGGWGLGSTLWGWTSTGGTEGLGQSRDPNVWGNQGNVGHH